MTPPEPSASAEELLAHADWLRRLAGSLVRDAEGAEELSQETWVRALAHPPASGRPLRGWLATVMRHALSDQRRGEARRQAREELVARAAKTPSGDAPDDGERLLEELAAQRRVLEAVRALEEPYRTTVLLRFFDGLGPRRIALRQGVPLATVKARLARGLARLRERLQREQGTGDGGWVVALLPLLRPGLAPAPLSLPLSLGALAVNAKLVLALVVVAAGAAGASVWLRRPSQEGPAPEVAAAEPARPGAELPALPAETAPAPPAPPPASEPDRERVPVERPSAGTSPAVPAPARAMLVRGRVVDAAGSPVVGAAIRARSADGDRAAGAALTESGPGGAFTLRLEHGGQLVVQDERWTCVLGGIAVDAESGEETTIVVAPRLRLAGRVIDDAGAPVAQASALLSPPADLRARLGLVLDHSFALAFGTTSDEDGRFVFADAPALAGATLSAAHEGLDEARGTAPLVSRDDLVLVLSRPTEEEHMLRGVVVDPHGASVEGARVSLGIDTTLTDAQGAFLFRLDDPRSSNALARSFVEVDTSRLLAVKPGYRLAELAASGRDATGQPVWPAQVVLRLGAAPLSITGRVVDEESEPWPGALVWLADPTFFGGIRAPDEEYPRFTHVENELAGAAPGWHFVTADADGRFTLEGLLDREYVLAAMDEETLQRTELPGVAAGRDGVTLTLSRQAVWPVLRGRVVDRSGAPLEGASVFSMCDAFETRVSGQVVSTHHEAGRAVRTDENGTFELERVPRDLVYLRIEHPDAIPLEWGRKIEGGLAGLVGGRPDQLVITVGLRCHFTISLTDPSEADAVGMLDAAGQTLEISEFLGNGRREHDLQPLSAGRSNPLAVSDAATTLVLYKGDEEVRRVPVRLDPHETTALEP